MEQKTCELCGLPITDLMRHLACTALEKAERDNEIDTKDIRLTSLISMEQPLTIAFDVDGTLRDEYDQPIRNVIDALLKFVKAGCRVIVWSGGGKDYAEMVGRALKLPETVLYYGKVGAPIVPDIAIDDCEVSLGFLNLRTPRN